MRFGSLRTWVSSRPGTAVALLVTLTFFAGCVDPSSASPCPGHFHVALLVADGEDVVSFYDEEALKAHDGMHVHDDSGIIHIHPSRERCIPLGDVLAAVDVAMGTESITVNGQSYSGTPRLDVRLWGQEWRQGSLSDLNDPVKDATRVLVTVGTEDIAAMREQVPMIPSQYEPQRPS